ncbi:uncharacterized protein B0H18DRAFT_1087748 [Fomitopsis serialis]|uniref:uncharacterized protein n=1 Tax=Fomitopsis serialis TaxID=139415 RepID=UPI0020075E37|nr:uncharacterized protein B0H18DRAFT_1087748 [Neoantrodia serialis]KAH9914717.1 hypothetical protein B0H18DRAFT_1087748 [Neoantrodia serialis]
MSERKVLPAGFRSGSIPRRKQPKNSQQVVRLMAPFSMEEVQCSKGDGRGEDYYGIKIFRFYINVSHHRCSTLCSAEITFKTDPKNTDYTAEHGASRNFEPWREEKAVEEEDRRKQPMKALENRTVDSKREMDILDALQDIRARNARNERIGQSVDLIETEEDRRRKLEEDEDEKLVREVFQKIPATGSSSSSGSSGHTSQSPEEPAAPVVTLKRKAEGAEPDLHSLLPEETRALISSKVFTAAPPVKKKKTDMKNSLGIKINKGKGVAKPKPVTA